MNGFVEHRIKGTVMRKREMEVFVIEEDARFSGLLEKTITDNGHSVTRFDSVEDCLKYQRGNPDLAFIGQSSKDTNSNMALMQEIKFNSPSTKLVILSQKDSLDLAVRALKNGASDFLVKDAKILARIGSTLQKTENALVRSEPSWKDKVKRFALPTIGVSAFASMLQTIF